eukprot:gene2331-2799_t
MTCCEDVAPWTYNYTISPRDIIIFEPQILDHFDHAFCGIMYCCFPYCFSNETPETAEERRQNQFMLVMILSVFFLPSIFDCIFLAWIICGDGRSMIYLDTNAFLLYTPSCENCNFDDCCEVCSCFGDFSDVGCGDIDPCCCLQSE